MSYKIFSNITFITAEHLPNEITKYFVIIVICYYRHSRWVWSPVAVVSELVLVTSDVGLMRMGSVPTMLRQSR